MEQNRTQTLRLQERVSELVVKNANHREDKQALLGQLAGVCTRLEGLRLFVVGIPGLDDQVIRSGILEEIDAVFSIARGEK